MRSSDLNLLREYGPLMEARMRRIPSILDVNSDLQVRARSAMIDIDRDIASRLGVSVDQIRLLLYSAFGTRQVSTIYASDDTYQVILEADPKYGDTATSCVGCRSGRRTAAWCRWIRWPSASTSRPR